MCLVEREEFGNDCNQALPIRAGFEVGRGHEGSDEDTGRVEGGVFIDPPLPFTLTLSYLQAVNVPLIN